MKKTVSFDIFDTCLVRKCGTPDNLLDVLSFRVFSEPVNEDIRQDFVIARKNAEASLWKRNPFAQLTDVYAELHFGHSYLLPLNNLIETEISLETSLWSPVIEMVERIEELRKKGNHIIFISDMYLSEATILPKMVEFGFFKDGDSLYVSCEVGKRKEDGSLYQYIAEKEKLDFSHWLHVGDNERSDFEIPKQLGIKAELVSFGYHFYPSAWLKRDSSIGFKYPSILAGLCRALSLSNPNTIHRDLVVDVIAPLYVSWVYRVLEDASRNGIARLYFCARDAYQIFNVALCSLPYFPEIQAIEYLKISRDALYKEENAPSKIAYFKNIGLASKTDKVAIVDITTSGMTLKYLNEFLSRYGFNEVKSYYYLLWNRVSGINRDMYNALLFDEYIRLNKNIYSLQDWKPLWVFENAFSINGEKKTVDYIDDVPVQSTVLGEEDVYVEDVESWSSTQVNLLGQFVAGFMAVGLDKYNKECLVNIALPTLSVFLHHPQKFYLSPFLKLKMRTKDGESLPFIKRKSALSLLFGKSRDYIWRAGCVSYNIPAWLLRARSHIRSC